jgi:hypothetical protein
MSHDRYLLSIITSLDDYQPYLFDNFDTSDSDFIRPRKGIV